MPALNIQPKRYAQGEKTAAVLNDIVFFTYNQIYLKSYD